MHSYLRAVGFSKYKNRRQLEQLYLNIMRSANRKMITTISVDTSLIQFEKDFGPGFGLSLIGEYDIEGNVSIEHCFPYLRTENNYFCKYEHISIDKQTDKESYAGTVDDYRLGMSIIFYIVNIADYAKSKWLNYSNRNFTEVKFSALSTSGTILLGSGINSKQRSYAYFEKLDRDNLLLSAKKGDEEAMEKITFDEIETYNSIAERVQEEDILSIVDTSFMPCGVECDHYLIIGDIGTVEEVTNTYSQEKMYLLGISANNLIFKVLINQDDLQGEPMVGRRFRGEIWLQGTVKI